MSSEYDADSSSSVNEISQVTNLINNLYSELETSLSNANNSPQDSENIIKNIEVLLRVKSILIANYVQMNTSTQDLTEAQKIAYMETMAAIAASNKEIEETKKKIALLNQEKFNKLRLIEINNYYGSQYNSYQKVIWMVILYCFILLILVILRNKQIIPPKPFGILVVILTVVFVITIGYMIIDIRNRSNMVFDEFSYNNFNYNQFIQNYPASTAPTSTSTYDSSSNSFDSSFNICPTVNSYCGTGTYYDASYNQCVANS